MEERDLLEQHCLREQPGALVGSKQIAVRAFLPILVSLLSTDGHGFSGANRQTVYTTQRPRRRRWWRRWHVQKSWAVAPFPRETIWDYKFRDGWGKMRRRGRRRGRLESELHRGFSFWRSKSQARERKKRGLSEKPDKKDKPCKLSVPFPVSCAKAPILS